MYSEQLEQLIKSVIADGVITEKERAVLHKKAAAEGVDEDEIDVYVDGLLAQKQPVEKVEEKKDLDIDTSMLKKVPSGFRGKRTIEKKLDGVAMERLFVNFFIDQKGKVYLVVKILGDEDYNNIYLENCNLYIDGVIMEISDCYNRFEIKTDGDGYKVDDTNSYEIDSGTLKIICESKSLKMTISTKAHYANRREFDSDGKPIIEEEKEVFKDINMNEIKQLARELYRATIDKNAYKDEDFNIDDQLAIRLISGNPKKLEEIKPCPSSFKQYKGVDGFIVTHVKGHLEFENSEHECRLEVLTNAKGENHFYFGFIGSREKGEDLEITVSMKSYQLRYVEDTDKHWWDYADGDYSFYEVDELLLKEIMTTKMDVLFDKELKNKQPKSWNEAFGYLTNPKSLEEWRVNEANDNGGGLFSKFKKLFG